MTRSVAVLMGGWSSEREVSLSSGGQMAKALEHAGYDVRRIDVRHDIPALLRALSPAPDVVVNALHGRYGEDGRIQGLLDCLGIPYTHSGMLASAIAMDKPTAKRLFEDEGIRCAPHEMVSRADFEAGRHMAPPFVMKPVDEGSSVGVHIVLEAADIPSAADWSFGAAVMMEKYVPGRELTVGVMGDRALGVTEIRPRTGFYDYAAKYTEGRADHLIPAQVHPDIYAEAMDFALRAHRTLGCRGVSRSGLRYDDTQGEPGRLFLLEVNTQPGMTPLSLVPEQAAHAGIGFGELVVWMVENAQCDG
ncbi:MAG: D-alanine--D-alanine ligase [Rhodospirillaceae bacterium]